MKRIYFIILILLPLLSSCSTVKPKDAYCFSMVFERSGDSAVVTLYCKTQKDPTSTEFKDIVITRKDDEYGSALKGLDKGDYNIYFNSICAYYFCDTLTEKDIHRIAILLLDNAKYKTDNYILAGKNASSAKMHEYAKDTCKSESIKRSDMKLYTPFLKMLRELN